MESYFYKTKKLTLDMFQPTAVVKNKDELYTSLYIINDSDTTIRIIEVEDEDNIDFSLGTPLGGKKLLDYCFTPKNKVIIYSNSTTPVDILVKYSE